MTGSAIAKVGVNKANATIERKPPKENLSLSHLMFLLTSDLGIL